MKRRSHGKIDQLSEPLRVEVEKRLIEGHTYADIAEYLKGMGKEIHAMSVQRYGRPFLQRMERVRDAKMFAKAIAEDNIDRPTTEIHEANNAIISQILMETIMSDETETAEKLKAASAIAQLQGAQVRNEKLKIDARKARSVFEIAIRELKEAVFEELGEHPQIADAVIRIADSKLSEVERAINV